MEDNIFNIEVIYLLVLNCEENLMIFSVLILLILTCKIKLASLIESLTSMNELGEIKMK